MFFKQELDVKAGGGHFIPIGEMLKQFLTKLEWYSTLFPRIPVPIQKQINENMKQHELELRAQGKAPVSSTQPQEEEENERPRGRTNRESPVVGFGEAERIMKLRGERQGSFF